MAVHAEPATEVVVGEPCPNQPAGALGPGRCERRVPGPRQQVAHGLHRPPRGALVEPPPAIGVRHHPADARPVEPAASATRRGIGLQDAAERIRHEPAEERAPRCGVGRQGLGDHAARVGEGRRLRGSFVCAAAWAGRSRVGREPQRVPEQRAEARREPIDGRVVDGGVRHGAGAPERIGAAGLGGGRDRVEIGERGCETCGRGCQVGGCGDGNPIDSGFARRGRRR